MGSVIRLGELFCGPGGLALGASQVKTSEGTPAFTHVWANDVDRDTCDTFCRNIPGASSTSVICQSVRDLNLAELPTIDCLAFGFPCNDFSVVGEQLGFEGMYGPLYSYGVELLNIQSPQCFVAENVSGLTSANEGRAFEKIVCDLESAGAGYSITAHLYKAEEYGVPQRRRRILLVGIRKDFKKAFQVPQITTPSPLTVRDVLIENPVPADALNNELTVQSPQVIERLRHILPGQNAFNADLPPHLKLQVKGAQISQIYKRLDPDQPSYTVTGSGGGGTHIYHWSENRALTNRERARLQGFPDTFEFAGKRGSVRKQIGMAVPPPLAEVVFRAIYHTLNDVDYEIVSPNLYSTTNTQYSFVMEKLLAYR